MLLSEKIKIWVGFMLLDLSFLILLF